jgi:2-dehydropantoate 2-reductase
LTNTQSNSGKPSIVILGAGGVGGYLGARLISAGANVSFLVREARAARLRATGLSLSSPLGNVVTPVKIITSAEQIDRADLVVLACKSFDLERALSAVAPMVREGTRVLPLLNGIRHIDLLNKRGLAQPQIGGIVSGGLDMRPDGSIFHLTPFFTLTAGTFSGEPDCVLQRFLNQLQCVNVDAKWSPHIAADIWAKFAFLTTLAGITCLMRASIGSVAATEAGVPITLELFDECRAVATAEGHPLDSSSIDTYRTLLTEPASTFTSSMLRDIEGRRPIEADHILGDMLRRAQERGIAAPVLRMAYTHTQAYEEQLRNAAPGVG